MWMMSDDGWEGLVDNGETYWGSVRHRYEYFE